MAQALPFEQPVVTPWRAYGALAIGIVCIAWSAIFVKWAGVSGPASAFYRVFVATVVLVPWFVGRQQTQTSRRGMVLAVAAGLFFALDLALWNSSIMLTSAANSTLLAGSAPFWVGIGAWWVFRERLPRAFWIGMAVAFAGAALIVGGDVLRHPSLGRGDVLALLAAITYAGYLLLMQCVRVHLDTLTALTVCVVVSSAALLGLCLLLHVPLTGYSRRSWVALVGLGLVSQVGGWLAINYALGHIKATITSVSLLFQPVLTALFAIPLLGELLRTEQIVGGALVLGGVYVVHRKQNREPRTQN